MSNNDVITSIDYNESDEKFIKIRQLFKDELKRHFSVDGDNYDEIIKYIFEGVFKNKTNKQTCIKDFESIFKNKTEEIINKLWKFVDDVVNEKKRDLIDDLTYQKKEYKKRNYGHYNKGNKFSRNNVNNRKRNERSRSRDGEDPDYYRFQNPRGNYPPMMPIQGFYPPRVMQFRPRPIFKKHIKTSKTDPAAQNKVNEANTEPTEEDKKNKEITEEFNKMNEEEQKVFLEKRVPTKKVRCKNWPGCKNPTCEYTHPTQTVKFLLIIFIYSVLIFLIVCSVINVVIFILIFLANMDTIVLG
jgi:hypothetical protein